MNMLSFINLNYACLRSLTSIFVLLVVMVQSAHTNLVPRIIDGRQAPDGRYNYTGKFVYVDTVNEKYWHGTATLISNKVALTTVTGTFTGFGDPIPAGDSDIRFGTAHEFRENKEHVYGISQIITHPGYDGQTLKNDVAVLILNDTVPESVAMPIKVITDKEYPGLETMVAGFGMVVLDRNSTPPNKVMVTTLKVGSISYCKSSYRTLNDGEFCTIGVDGRGPCFGDGGGPVVVKTDSGELGLLGINSRRSLTSGNPGVNCANENNADVHVRLSDYLNFIVEAADLNKDDITFAKGALNEPSSTSEEESLSDSSEDSSGEDSSDEDNGDEIEVDNSDISSEESSDNDNDSYTVLSFSSMPVLITAILSIMFC